MIKFLIIRFSSIGDIVLTTPVIRCLKKQHKEEALVHFLTKEQYKIIVINNPYIDKIHILNKNFRRTIEELEKEKFDYIIDLHNNIRTLRIKLNLKIPTESFNKINIRKFLIVNFKINKLPDTHIVDRYLNTIKKFGIQNDNKGLDYFIPQKDKVDINSLPKKFHKNYVFFAIGAQHNTKKLPPEQIIEICNNIKYPIIISGGKADNRVGEFVEHESKNIIFNSCGKYNLNQSASLAKQSKIVITHDTGLMHIAAAFNKKIISIWGNTIPEFGMYPYMPDKKYITIEVKNLRCRPCSKIGYKKCPKKHFKCMKNIKFKSSMIE